MPYGSGMVIRQALVHAKPWQRYAIALAMIGGGAGLVLLGHAAGALLAAAGALLAWRMLRYRVRSTHDARPRVVDGAQTDRCGGVPDDSP